MHEVVSGLFHACSLKRKHFPHSRQGARESLEKLSKREIG